MTDTDIAIAQEVEDPRMSDQEIYDTLKRIIKDAERMLRHYEAKMRLEG